VIRGRFIAASHAMERIKKQDRQLFLQTEWQSLVLGMECRVDRVIKQAAEMSLRGNTWQTELKEPKN